VSLVASHTPEACWPGSGWEEDRPAYSRVPLKIANRELPSPEHRLFRYDGYPQHVWYWHLYDAAPIHHEGVESARKLLSLAWHYGFRNDAEQAFVRISSNRDWTQLSGEPLVGELFGRLQTLGLK
jgi:hypothetical protein